MRQWQPMHTVQALSGPGKWLEQNFLPGVITLERLNKQLVHRLLNQG
jgi:hypothetical protein